MSALVELDTHAPLRAVLGLDKESALSLSAALLDHLPPGILLILDRLYGQAPMLAQLQAKCRAQQEQHFLVWVRMKLGVKIINLLEDGSAMVEVALRDQVKPRRVLQSLRVREVHGRVWKRSDNKWVDVRLWTSLSVEQTTAKELLGLYARRRELTVALAQPPRRKRSCARKVRQPIKKWQRMITSSSSSATIRYEICTFP